MNMKNKKGIYMRSLFLFTFAMLSVRAYSVCNTPLTRTNAGFQNVLTSTKYNTDVNMAYNQLNNLPGDCVTDASITTAKLADEAVTTSKIADGAITAIKVASGAIPEAGRLLRVSSFVSSGTWTKLTDVGSIMIQVVGGGGASFHASSTTGGNSSFGAHCTANGGGKPASSTSAGGAGGSATSGDINLTGGNGDIGAVYSGTFNGGYGGRSMIGSYGQGGIGSYPSFPSSGGGAGGYCAKLILAASLNPTETITIGAGGTNPGSNTTAGKSGIVLVYEYSK
jgi:hypothetical protein